jgi:hypothetical protein
MRSDFSNRTVLVPLSETFVDVLLKMHAALGPELTDALQASIAGGQEAQSSGKFALPNEPLKLPSKRYSAQFLGVFLTAWTLPDMFAEIVDMTAQVAPEALDKLATMQARKRRFVSRTKEAIHPDNRHLPTMQTVSGWWISKNIGQRDLKRALRNLADAAGLTYGRDVIFPVTRCAA